MGDNKRPCDLINKWHIMIEVKKELDPTVKAILNLNTFMSISTMKTVVGYSYDVLYKIIQTKTITPRQKTKIIVNLDIFKQWIDKVIKDWSVYSPEGESN